MEAASTGIHSEALLQTLWKGETGCREKYRGNGRGEAAEEAVKPVFYSSSGVTWDKSLILLVVRCRFRESVVPRFSAILVDFSGRIATLCAHQPAEPPCTSAARPRPGAPTCRSSRATATATRCVSK